MKHVIFWSALVAIFAAVELWLGISEPADRVALVLLCWSALAVPVSLGWRQCAERLSGEVEAP